MPSNKRCPFVWIGALAALLLAGCGQYVRYDGEAPAAPVAPGAASAGLEQVTQLEHRALADLLASFTVRDDDGQALVDYPAWEADPEARYQLEAYVGLLAGVDPSGLEGPAERLAYWINGYNAGVIQGVLERFERDLSFRVIDSPQFFSGRRYTFGGLVISLDQLEHLAMRGQFGEESYTAGLSQEELDQLRAWHEQLWPDGEVDARLHAAVNCGAIGCPDLLAVAPFVWRADQIEAQLERATRRWLADPATGAGPDGISRIFTWFEPDFVAHSGGVSEFIAAHRERGLEGVELGERLEYDWALNTAR